MPPHQGPQQLSCCDVGWRSVANRANFRFQDRAPPTPSPPTRSGRRRHVRSRPHVPHHTPSVLHSNHSTNLFFRIFSSGISSFAFLYAPQTPIRSQPLPSAPRSSAAPAPACPLPQFRMAQRELIRQLREAARPPWQLDSDTDLCMRCSQTFRFDVRRHHCRCQSATPAARSNTFFVDQLHYT
jgi:hypothetical protein